MKNSNLSSYSCNFELFFCKYVKVINLLNRFFSVQLIWLPLVTYIFCSIFLWWSIIYFNKPLLLNFHILYFWVFTLWFSILDSGVGIDTLIVILVGIWYCNSGSQILVLPVTINLLKQWWWNFCWHKISKRFARINRESIFLYYCFLFFPKKFYPL